MKICLSCEGVSDTPAARCGHCGAVLLQTDAVHFPVRRGEADAQNPLLGTVLDGKYRLQSVLGRGGLGTVFRAQHIGSLATVALKLLHPRYAERAEYRRALLPEARAAATVTNQHCARLLDVGEAEAGIAWLAMELVDGSTLDQLVQRGPLPPSHAVDLLLQIADALVAIHGAGLVHCDLSPRNVMVAAGAHGPQVKVLDFGIARSASRRDEPAGNTLAGFASPAFAAPELLAGGAVDARADLWSFGALACLLLQGRAPADDGRAGGAPQRAVAPTRPQQNRMGGRLSRLVAACLATDPAQRPRSAAAIAHELQVIRGARRGPLAPIALVAAVLAVVATVAATPNSEPPFLRPVSGTELTLHSGPLGREQLAQDLQPTKLHTLGFHFGGFRPHRLRADLARAGSSLRQTSLQPAVDAAVGTLLLSNLQPEWNDCVETLLRTSRDGPIDISFVVPGSAPLGTARVRLDGEPPQGELVSPEGPLLLAADTRLVVRLRDDIGVAAASLRVRFAAGQSFDLPVPPAGGPLALGGALAALVGTCRPLGPGVLALAAKDAAGNELLLPERSFFAADVAAPVVEAVTGPAGEPFAPLEGNRVRLRLRLVEAEPGCRVHVRDEAVVLGAFDLTGDGPTHLLEFELPRRAEPQLTLQLRLEDAAGNHSDFAATLPLRDRTLTPSLGVAAGIARMLNGELVATPDGAALAAAFGPGWTIASARIELAGPRQQQAPAVQLGAAESGHTRIAFGSLPAGLHQLRLWLRDGADEDGMRTEHVVPLRILPAAIELQLPVARGRFLPDLLAAGVLAARGDRLVEGPGWRLDPELRPFVRGQLWVATPAAVALPLVVAAAGATAPLLPDVAPVAGRNQLAVELLDVLDRPLKVQRDDGEVLVASRIPCADFWWSDRSPEPVGEQVLVEYGEAARVRLRCPLPFTQADRERLRLGIADDEVQASAVMPIAGDSAEVVFDLSFAQWSVAAKLAGRPRGDYDNQLDGTLSPYFETPAGRHDIRLRLRTVRSTLQPLRLGELGVAPALAGLLLLPVLAPAGPFEPPLPQAPPFPVYRPQSKIAVRNLTDLLLLDREFPVGAARHLASTVAPKLSKAERAACIHLRDPLGSTRLVADNLLPAAARSLPDGDTLVGVDYYQAYALCCLLGVATGGDPQTFRLPFGCELELAAYTGQRQPAGHGAAAQGGGVAMRAFRGDLGPVPHDAASALGAGDSVATAFGVPFIGLDFGVREWVSDLPHVAGAAPLIEEWIRDHVVHLARVQGLARGDEQQRPHPFGLTATLGVVRGLAFGEIAGLIDGAGAPIDPTAAGVLPATVPGVLRTEQLRRDGGDLLGGRDPRLLRIGFRVAAPATALLRPRGQR